jgi:hypothetical protein
MKKLRERGGVVVANFSEQYRKYVQAASGGRGGGVVQ